VTEDHVVFVSERLHQPFAFAEVDRDTFEIMIGDHAMELGAVKIMRRQAVPGTGDGHSLRGVGMHDVVRVLARHVDRRMDGEAGGVDARAARMVRAQALK
jgi:hypothetical protein